MKVTRNSIYRLLFIFLGIAFLFQSCKPYKDVTVVGVENVNVKSFKKGELKMDVDVKINNPNPYSIKVSSSNINVSINKINLSNAQIDKTITLEKKSSEVYTVPISADWSSADSNASVLDLVGLAFMKQITIKIDGGLKASVWGGTVKKNIPIKYNRTIQLRK